MDKKVVYGAGKIAKDSIFALLEQYDVVAIIDGNSEKWGKTLFDIPIISLDEYIEKYNGIEIIIALNEANTEAVLKKLYEKGITCYKSVQSLFINLWRGNNRKVLMSHSDSSQMEDVILYNVFADYDEVFYIDVGSNDPIIDSVTRLLYDIGKAHGINIDPIKELIDLTNEERPRDINVCCGIGNKEGTLDFYIQSGLSSALEENIDSLYYKEKRTVPITTLKKICDKYISENQEIAFLKIDVEGLEREVLEGADFTKYRPQVIVMEATLPNTDIPCYDKWEDILIDNGYHFVFTHGVNRYYVADEHKELDSRFIPVKQLLSKYRILTALPIEWSLNLKNN